MSKKIGRNNSTVKAFALMGTMLVSLIITTQQATADDMVGGYDWTGTYAGISAGYGWADKDSVVNRDLTNLNDHIDALSNGFKVNGAYAGAQLGYNCAINPNIIIGLEGDLGWAGVDGKDTTTTLDIGGVPGEQTLHGVTRSVLTTDL